MIVQFRRDFRAGTHRVLAPLSALFLLLYAIALAWDGQRLGAGLSAGLAALAAFRAWRMRRAVHVGQQGLWIAAVNVGGCLLGCSFSGATALPWLFPTLMVNYFLCEPRRAVVMNVPLVLAPILLPGLLTSIGQGVSVIAVSLLTLVLGLAFSLRIQDDRVQLEEMASLDALTGLPNRRMLERTLTRQIEERREHERLNGLIILDLDHFKDINDLYGHAAGDAALADLATILRFEVRGDDEVFRFGGEEFVVLLRVESLAELELATERLRRAIRGALRGPGGKITVSLGAARHAGETHWQDWFSRADAALYLAKNNGRDSYRIADHL
ncbi:GGDEF domain-containing protein [Stenotrophomonas sp. HITSZ_GD]|uniref:GGDEF domain-containing protein n=1 Tax=Stenotrophomonas sp. HITSZ_GD TaxID=3037248 RepID=UPI00240E0229|nr:GGDEF domain-containing protein [Stenotrophomonas sp. HITSZ_GD]MDG2526561.1 GGDEF domain-containing protein [Stenotrophomonas sp. HITSZ_GD]